MRRVSKEIRPYTRLFDSLMTSKAFKELDYGTRLTYICMLRIGKNTKEFRFTSSMYKECGLSKILVNRAVHKLIQARFIELLALTKEGTVYRFIDAWKQRV